MLSTPSCRAVKSSVHSRYYKDTCRRPKLKCFSISLSIDVGQSLNVVDHNRLAITTPYDMATTAANTEEKKKVEFGWHLGSLCICWQMSHVGHGSSGVTGQLTRWSCESRLQWPIVSSGSIHSSETALVKPWVALWCFLCRIRRAGPMPTRVVLDAG